jgi:hypothetical protein
LFWKKQPITTTTTVRTVITPHDHDGHGHTHGVVDPTIATTERGIWAIEWSFVGLMTTALFQTEHAHDDLLVHLH